MIRKTNENLLNWIYEYIIDFTDESDTSGLSWESTHDDALKFLQSIPQKDRVQKYGFYSSHSNFFLVESIDDIVYVLRSGFISEQTCRKIYKWNSAVGRENWNMEDVLEISNQPSVPSIDFESVSNTFHQLIELGLIECINPEAEHGKLYRLTETGEEKLQ